MTTLHIEHPIRDFATWKAAFDRDPIGRERGGVRRYQVFRPMDDPHYIIIDLEFDDSRAAESFLAALRELWQSPAATPVLAGSPQTRLIEVVETKTY